MTGKRAHTDSAGFLKVRRLTPVRCPEIRGGENEVGKRRFRVGNKKEFSF